MPLKTNDISMEYSTGGTPLNRGFFRRINPMVYLTICCTLFILAIVAALIVFTFLPIFTTTKGNQTKHQIQSDVLLLIYNLPDQLSISSMNWSYVTDELDLEKLNILQNLLQEQLNEKRITKKTSLTVTDAYIVHQISASASLVVVSPVILDHNNKTIIRITQPGIETHVNSTDQLIISLKLRYAIECSKRCQRNIKESVFAKIFSSLDVPLDTFQLLFTERIFTFPNQILSSSTSSRSESTTRMPCIVSTPSSTHNSAVVMARNYEAESATNTFISTLIQTCTVCSGEQKVTNIGFSTELILEQILSTSGGLTTVVFYYTTDRLRFAQISLNDQITFHNITFPALLPHESIASLSILFNLCQGLNSFRIYNRHDFAPDIDRIVVY